MLVYNSQTHKKEELEPIEPGKIRMYVCGPTVYDQIHIGNARTFLAFDVIRRYLMYKGYQVTFAQNLTDVDDKIINRANETGRTAAEVAEECSVAFIEQMHRFGVLDPDIRPRATHEIEAMQEMISLLIERGVAYPVPSGDVYFSVRADPPATSTSPSAPTTTTASSPGAAWIRCAPASAWRSTTRSAIPSTLPSGRPPSPASPAGPPRGATAVPAGTPSAAR